MNKYWLRGKTVVITGMGSSLGKFLAYNLILKYNCNVIGIDLDESSLVNFYDKIVECQQNFKYYSFDVSNEKAWDFFFNENKVSVDVLINCVGLYYKSTMIENLKISDLKKIIVSNYFAYVISAQKLLPYLKKSREPAIINISCFTSQIHAKGSVAYSSAKSAINSFSQILKHELDKKFYVGLVLCGLMNDKNFKDSFNLSTKRGISADKMSDKIINAISKKKSRVAIGFNAKFIDISTRLFPTFSNKLFNKYIDNRNKVNQKSKDIK